MATLNTTSPTMLDLAKLLGPDDKISAIIEILDEQNEVIPDVVWKEGNLLTGHKDVMRTGIPAPTWRKLNGGVLPVKSTTAPITFNCGMMEQYAKVDKALAELNGNTAAFRLSQDKAIIEGMNQEFVDTLFYGNEGTEPEAFTGLTPHLNLTTADNGGNIILGGGAGTDNASIWLIGWGEGKIQAIYPKGSKVGLQHTDKGLMTIQDQEGVTGAMME